MHIVPMGFANAFLIEGDDGLTAESGGPLRPMTPAPGLLGQVLCRLFFDPEERLEPVAIDQPLTAGDTLPIAGGIEVIHAPGHCAGPDIVRGPNLTRSGASHVRQAMPCPTSFGSAPTHCRR